MSKALAFVAGIAVIIVLLLVLFSPRSGTQTDGATANDPVSGPASGDAGSDATAGGSPGGDSPAAGGATPTAAPRANADATAALPARPDNPARDARPAVSLWQAGPDTTRTEVDGFPATRLQADPQALSGLHVGQQVTMEVPDLNRTITARLTSTHNQLNKVEVFRGPVTGGHDKDNVIVTRGKTATYVVLSTREGVYSAVINNGTGEAVLTSETDIQDNLAGENDAIPVPGIDQEPPPG